MSPAASFLGVMESKLTGVQLYLSTRGGARKIYFGEKKGEQEFFKGGNCITCKITIQHKILIKFELSVVIFNL